MLGILPPLIVLSSMTLIGTKLNLHLLYPIQCMMSMGSAVDMFLLTIGQFCPHLGWLSFDAIEKETFEHTTQLACMVMSTRLKK
jgi:hypothetical protein